MQVAARRTDDPAVGASSSGAAGVIRSLLRRIGLGGTAPYRTPTGAPETSALEWDVHRRRSTRRYARRTALLTVEGGGLIRCRIADMSEHGMRLLLPSRSCVLPARFSLILVESGVMYRVRRVWRRSVEVGVEFEDSQTLLTSRTEHLYHTFMRRLPQADCRDRARP